LTFPIKDFIFFQTAEKAKPAARRRRKATDLSIDGDSRVACKGVTRFFYLQRLKIKQFKNGGEFMKRKNLLIIFLAVLVGVIGITHNAKAEVINFDDQGLSGPSLFVNASPSPQHLDINVTGIGNVQFDGGVILTATAFLPANQTSLYGTTDLVAGGMLNPLTITFPSNITNFFLDVYNGLTTDIEYQVSDNMGNSALFTLVPNLNGGTTQIGFAAAGDHVFVQSITPGNWDFFIDNIHFNEPLPQVPVPGTMLLLGSGLAALVAVRRKFNI
jgi:hypothetical protein